MGLFDDVTVTPASKTGVFNSVTPTTKTTGSGLFAHVTAAPQAPAAPAASPYFEGKEPSGAFVGISNEVDPFSGRPYFAYTPAGATSTTTDKTRVASKTNPEVATPQPRGDFTNPRLPETASQAIRALQGAKPNEQLDHAMALALGGSNDTANLRVIPTSENQAAGKGEGAMSSDVAAGKLSLFQAQNMEAQAKGLPAPWTDQDIQKASVLKSIASVPDNSVLGIIKNTILGIPAAASKLLGSAGQTNDAGLKNLQQASGTLDTALASLGPNGDALVKMKSDLDSTKVDSGNEASVNAYNNKVNAFNTALQSYNFKSTQAQKLVDVYGKAVDSFNGSVIAPSGTVGLLKGVADGIIKQYTAPSADEQSLESNLPTGIIKTIEAPILRTVEPMLEPLVHDATAALIFNQPELYNDFVTMQKQGTTLPQKEVAEGANKTPLQVVGDTAQAVLGSYFPDIFGEGLQQFASKGVQQAVLATATHGAVAGFSFGVAQAASSGSKDPKELAAIVLQNTIGGAMLTLATAGVTHGAVRGAGPVVDAIKERLPQSLAEAQRGFVHIPGLGDLPEEGDVAPAKQEQKQEQKPESALTEAPGVEQPALDEQNTQESTDNLSDIAHASPTAEDFHAALTDDEKQQLVGAVDTKDHLEPVENPQELHPDTLEKLDNLQDVLKEKGSDALYTKGEDGGLARIDTASAAKAFYERAGTERSNAEAKITPETLENMKAEIDLRKDTMANDPAKHLLSYYGGQDPRFANLDDIFSRSVNKSGARMPSTKLDSIVQEMGYSDVQDAHEGVVSYLEEKSRVNALEAFYKRLSSERKAQQALEKQTQGAKNGNGRGRSKQGTRGTQGERPLIKGETRATNRINSTPNRPGYLNNGSSRDYNTAITEHNGGVIPPENRGGMKPPEIDWTLPKDKAALRLSTDTMERNVEKIFGKEADKINDFLVKPTRANETARVKWANDVRAETKKYVVDKLGIKPGSLENRLIQQLGEGRIDLTQLKEKAPNTWENVVKATIHFREVYDSALDTWNAERFASGLKPIPKLENYFRHFVDLGDWVKKFGFNFTQGDLPTAIAGITEFFKSQTPWASASMRRLGSTFTDDAIGGLDNFIDNTSRAIYHTDSVQRGRLLEKYLRDSATANQRDVKLGNFASNLNDWTNLVSGKQAKLDRAIESVVGRPALAVLRAISRRFGANVIAGNVSSAVTHAIPFSYTLATVNKGAALQGLLEVLHSPFMDDFTKVDGIQSDFLTRRYGTEKISPTLGEKVGKVLTTPFSIVDKFISRFAVSAKYMEGLQKGLTSKVAMEQADNYAGRVIGDRSAGNLPNLMNTKTLSLITQFQIEVNDNLHVLSHDIPRWAEGNKGKIAGQFVQFAVYSFLFNQAMQAIKGSGKGLDPIDMGLTLAGINDEGHDKSVMERLKTMGGDLLKELPFTSIPTQGQIPAFAPIQQAATDAFAGNYLKSLEGILASFASPVGGGQQLQKTLTAIEAWKQGYVTDSQGHVTAKIDPTISNLIQGSLFGKSAFASVKKTNSEVTTLDNLIKAGQATGKEKNQQASAIWQQIKGMDPAAAKTQLEQVASQDPDMAKRVITYAKDDAAGLTKTDILTRSLGIANGARAAYINQQLQGMKTNDEKKAYLSDLASKKILTDAVLKQIVGLMKK